MVILIRKLKQGNYMTNLEKYCNTYKKVFELDDNTDVTTLSFQGIPLWDSIGHMNLIASLEEAFGVQFEIDDIIDLSSFEKGKEILIKLGVDFN